MTNTFKDLILYFNPYQSFSGQENFAELKTIAIELEDLAKARVSQEKPDYQFTGIESLFDLRKVLKGEN